MKIKQITSVLQRNLSDRSKKFMILIPVAPPKKEKNEKRKKKDDTDNSLDFVSKSSNVFFPIVYNKTSWPNSKIFSINGGEGRQRARGCIYLQFFLKK